MQLDLRQIWNGLRKRWWIALLVMISAGAVAYLYSNAQPRVYQSRVTIAAKPVPPDNGLIEAIKKTMPTYAQELASPSLWQQVVDNNLIRNVDLGSLPGLIKVQPLPDQNSLVMTVDNADPVQAGLLAQDISEAFVEQEAGANQQTSAGGNRVVWDIVQPAAVPSDPYQPRPRLYGAAGALFGLVLGLLLVIGLELLDTTVKTPSDIEQYLGMHTLGVIPKGT